MNEVAVGTDRLAARLLPCGRDRAPLLLCIHGGGCNGRYFDIPGFSVAKQAIRNGYDVLLPDRPGHGQSPPARSAEPIAEAAELLSALLESLLRTRSSSRLVVLGHSIGGAIALTLAAERRIAIRAVAVSGIGRSPTPAALAWFQQFSADDRHVPPASFFFGPNGSYDWRAPIALRKVAEPWHPDEVHETLFVWRQRFDAIASRIAVPVSLHMADHEEIWDRSDMTNGKIAEAFVAAPDVVSGILPVGGHLYELHLNGAQMIEAQLAFFARTCRE